MMQAIHSIKQGYSPLYHPGDRCPGCNRGHWLVGRMLAECASCGTAIPIAPVEAVAASFQPSGSDRP